tara:strand:- start:14101 stop:14760 length:660 start_codon:yes stop_codon:yes gene_type:complete
MGYLNNQVVTIDAILTKKGRELLAKGDGSFKITQFALADDEIDYTMYNPSHPSGSAYAGEAIENMPLLEAFPDETQIMKYKLATLPRGTMVMPIIDLGQSNVILKQTAEKSITPQTLNYLVGGGTESSGYTFTISDIRLFSSFEGTGIDTPQAAALNSTQTTGTSVSKTVIGTTLSLRATGVNTLFGSNSTLYATLTIVGRDSGARLQIPVNITKTTTA